MKPIKAICFDLDGVYFTPKGKNSFHDALTAEYGIPKETVDAFMYRGAEMASLVRGEITNEEFWNRLREDTGITATDQELTERWVRDYEVNQDVRTAVLKAKELGYETCVCTNNNGIRLPILMERFQLHNDFDVIISSHQVGHTKPEKEIFEELIKALGIEPEELVYSDDNPARLHGAQELGTQTFVYENFDQFLGELKKLGVTL
jgi:putative hydrolase of the HAD superfamily